MQRESTQLNNCGKSYAPNKQVKVIKIYFYTY